MRLTDIMSNMDLAVYPMLALVLFGGVFVLVVGRAYRTDRAQHARWASIPLDDVDVGAAASTPHSWQGGPPMSSELPTTRAAAPDSVMDHQYDGIQEYDNPTPGWWFMIFAVSFVWACGYWVRYELNTTPPTVQQEWEDEVAEVNKVVFAKLGNLKPDQETMLSMAGNSDWMRVGASIFRANCIACHGRQGQGDVGPNLTDDSYKNVKVITDIPRVIREGANNQAMPAWRARLNENEIILVASYVSSLRGKNVAGRAPEGEVIPAWPTAALAAPEKKK